MDSTTPNPVDTLLARIIAWHERADDPAGDFAYLNDTGWTDIKGLVAEARMLLLSHDALLTAYQRTTGEPGDPEVDALLEKIER